MQTSVPVADLSATCVNNEHGDSYHSREDPDCSGRKPGPETYVLKEMDCKIDARFVQLYMNY